MTPKLPVVTRNDRRPPRFLNFGQPSRPPLRLPERASKKPFNARASAPRPALYASFEFAAHHGATSSLAWFHSRRNAGRLHGTGPATPAAHTTAPAVLAPWRTA